MSTRISRRSFLKGTLATSLAGPLIWPRVARAASPNGKLQHACIGVNGMAAGDRASILNTGRVDIVAICDVDKRFLDEAAAQLPNARCYRDWRELFAAEADKIDSVNVSTPDHTHAPATMAALNLGKHVYCQKPLTHTVYEARQITRATARAGVVTQMGVQIHSDPSYRLAVRMVQDGAIGKVKEWHSFQTGANVQSLKHRPDGSDPVPDYLDWDLWLGVAPQRPYKADIYHPGTWRSWQDFGCGVLGDFACHIFDPVFTALEIKTPLRLKAQIGAITDEAWPDWEIIEYEFVGTKWTAGPTIKATWYDAGQQPPWATFNLPADAPRPGAGSVVIGEQATMILPHWAPPSFYADGKRIEPPRPSLAPVNHYGEWVDACLGKGQASTSFDYSGPLTEAVQLGNIANHFAGQTLEWDAANLKFTNHPDANKLIHTPYRSAWPSL